MACAANFFPTLQEVCQRFEMQEKIRVNAVMGASGNLYAQVLSGAPYNIFFSANCEYPQKIHKDNTKNYPPPTTYVVGKLVMWTMKKELDLSKGMELLEDKEIKTIAIANPEYAPYGQRSKQALKFFKLWEKISHKLVFGKNASQTFQFAQTKNADIAFVPLSFAKKSGRYWQLPQESYTPINQCYVVLQQDILVDKFLLYFHNSGAILQKNGYDSIIK
ncbi:molybdate ABC transporter substrate-binding protein [Candidatus Uabimicrobium sp. HlEnr_7]|uniref:molybdate ABC transporter substrate-binding protein n=1 Tax=Candidatus Uabimicrobium helgolandensis TaxID=3095367 RepID=UPI003556FCBC